MPTTNAVAAVLKRLAALRRRVRLLVATSGAFRLVAGVAAVVVAWFLADRLLDLPLGVRRFVRLGLLDRPDGLEAVVWLALLAAAVVVFVVTLRHRSGIAAVVAFCLAGVIGLVAWMVG